MLYWPIHVAALTGRLLLTNNQTI